jgi:hypothetical protein
MKTVQILGTAPNLPSTPPLSLGAERWCCNSAGQYVRRWREADLLNTWTRWFNMHSRWHMERTYPDWLNWYKKQTKPIVMQRTWPDIPASTVFPRDELMRLFRTRYFTNSASWFIALAIAEGFERIELGGFLLRRDQQYDFERPCFFFWVEEAQRRGIQLWLPPDLEVSAGGDPTGYAGPLYGYETTHKDE